MYGVQATGGEDGPVRRPTGGVGLDDPLSTHGGQIRSLDPDRDGARVVVELLRRVDARVFVDALREQCADATLGGQRTVNREPATASGLEDAVTGAPTDKQREVLGVAHYSGYSERSHQSDEAGAETLGVPPRRSTSTSGTPSGIRSGSRSAAATAHG